MKTHLFKVQFPTAHQIKTIFVFKEVIYDRFKEALF